MSERRGAVGVKRTPTVLATPSAPDRQELLEWLDLVGLTDFDPDRFDTHDADTRLAALTWAKSAYLR